MKTYVCNDSYFLDIDNYEKAYWLGFLYADGYVRVRKKSGELKLKLSTKDRSHIETFKKCLDSNNPIRDGVGYIKKGEFIHSSNYSSINISCLELVLGLIKNGCVNNKTQKIRLPKMEKNLYSHFIRGYFDGDGSIHKVKKRPNSFTVSICSNHNFVRDILDFLKMGKIFYYENHACLIINKIQEVKKFRDYIYMDADIFLQRKKNVFEQINNEFKRDYNTKTNNKKYCITYLDGLEILTDDLVGFCKINDLKYSTMSNLSRGIGRTNKGWRCRRID